MNKYNPKIHHRRSIRLKGYDYSQAGLYFITICCQDKTCLFGRIENGEMVLNDAGKIIKKWYDELENKFSDIKCHEMIVMPNHFHCIIENVGSMAVGSDLCVCPNDNGQMNDDGKRSNENDLIREQKNNMEQIDEKPHNIDGRTDTLVEQSGNNTLVEHKGSTLPGVVQWFKTMTTNEYIRGVKNLGWKSFNGKLWQRNYYEHIIRNEQSYQNISKYIINNPKKWDEDKFHQQ